MGHHQNVLHLLFGVGASNVDIVELLLFFPLSGFNVIRTHARTGVGTPSPLYTQLAAKKHRIFRSSRYSLGSTKGTVVTHTKTVVVMREKSWY